jgi:GT2 family glycosyltransferase
MERIREEFNEDTYGTVVQKNRYLKNCTFDLYPQYKNIFTEIFFFNKFLNRVNWYDPRFVSLSGAFMIFGKNIIKKNGLFDDHYFLYYEETDYYYRLRNNKQFKIIYDRYITHKVSSSVDKNITIDKFKIHADSLYYYSRKFDDFKYLKSLVFIYKVSSLFFSGHKQRLNFLLPKINIMSSL